MRSVGAGGRPIAGMGGGVGLIVAGFVFALMYAGAAFGQLQLPTTTVTTPAVPSTTVATPSVPAVPTTTIQTPSVPTATVSTPRVSPPSPPPSPPPAVAPAPPPPALPRVTPPSPPSASLPRAPSAPRVSPPPASAAPGVQAPPPPVGAPSPPASPAAAQAPTGSLFSSTAGRSGGATGAGTGPSVQGSGGAATPAAQVRPGTAAAAGGGAFSSGSTYRPSQEPPYLVGLPSPNAAALDYGAFIVPTDGTANRLVRLGRGPLQAGQVNLLPLLGLPDFLRAVRAQATRRVGSEPSTLPDVKKVLGQQASLSDVGEGGGLTFGQLPLIALALVLLSSFLLVGAVLPPGVVARTPLSPVSYARAREPLALAAIGILVPVAVVALVVGLS